MTEMNTVYLDCASGISGDMMLGALVDAGVSLDAIQAGIDSLGLPRCHITRAEVKKKGFRATQIRVEHDPEQAHRHLAEIVGMIDQSAISPAAKRFAKTMFQHLAEAEARVHGTSVERVHFHEVGAVDSIADIVGTAIGWDLLGVDRAYASPVATGSGTVDIAHGRCPIPAPATAELLRGVPLVDAGVDGELTTPTGATILKTLIHSFGPRPAMTIQAIGYGAGQRELDCQANLLRLLVGLADADADDGGNADQVWVVETNLDDTPGEVIGFCTGALWEAGVLDVSLRPIQMKKNRPGVTVSVLCRPAEVERVEAILFRETSTLGIRRWRVERTKRSRKPHRVTTPWGDVAGVVAWLAGGTPVFSPEYESCRKVAERHGIALREVYDAARSAYACGRKP